MKANISDLPMMVKYHRLKKGWSQEDLASKANVSRHFVIRLENGEDNIGLDHVIVCLKALKINCYLTPIGFRPTKH